MSKLITWQFLSLTNGKAGRAPGKQLLLVFSRFSKQKKKIKNQKKKKLRDWVFCKKIKEAFFVVVKYRRGYLAEHICTFWNPQQYHQGENAEWLEWSL